MYKFNVYYELNGKQCSQEVQSSNASMASLRVEAMFPGCTVRIALPLAR